MHKKVFKFLPILILLLLANTGRADADADFLPDSFDVVVYGGTSAGVIAAVQVARMHKLVVLIEPGGHLGGMSASGLGATDHGDSSAIGGLSMEFYQRVYHNYHGGGLENPGQWKFEPHVAETVFNEMVSEQNIPVLFGERLDLEHGVTFDGGRIKSIILESGREISGTVFIDATYEGDLMASAGVSYTFGRESNDQYDETLNGVQVARSSHHNFSYPVDPYVIPGDPSSGLLPGVHDDGPGVEGSADERIQAYNFRLCMTNVPENRIAWIEPEEYDPLRYELLLRHFDAGLTQIPLHINQGVPNSKSDTNNRGAFSTDNIGMNYAYPDGDYTIREAIIREHEIYQRGLMWTLASNPRVPEGIRNTMLEWGLAADEFVDNNNWPWQLYIREARRMLSDYVMTECDCIRLSSPADPIGMGSYQIDSHNVQRYVDSDGHARNEGDVQVGLQEPYGISYRAIMPAIGECENLLVPVCVSATHVAYGTIRMEPVYMILGHSAGTAAVISIDTRTSVQDLFYPILREVLIHQQQVLPVTLRPSDLPGIVIDDSRAEFEGIWEHSVSVRPFVGDGYLHDGNTGAECTVRFTADIHYPGRYEVRFFYTPHANRATNVRIRIEHAGGTSEMIVNGRETPPIDGMSVSLGCYRFTPENPVVVTITDETADGYVVVDALQILACRDRE